MTEEATKKPETVSEVAAELRRHEESDKHKWEKVKAYEKKHRDHEDYDEDDEDDEDDDHEGCHKHRKHKMQEPVNVFTSGFPGLMGGYPAVANGAFGGEGMGLFGAILIGALLTGGFGGFGGFGGRGVVGDGTAVDAVLQNQDTASILAAINTTRTEANQGTGAVLSAVNNGFSQTSQNQSRDTQSVLTTIYGTGANLSNQICQETRNVIQGQFDLSRQMDQAFAANQIARAQDKYDSAQIAFQQTIQTNNQFAAVQAQMCANQNSLERQIAECCCELQSAIAGVTTARIQDELDACRLREAIAQGSGANGQVINQIAVSLGAITQTLAGLQAKLPA